MTTHVGGWREASHVHPRVGPAGEWPREGAAGGGCGGAGGGNNDPHLLYLGFFSSPDQVYHISQAW